MSMTEEELIMFGKALGGGGSSAGSGGGIKVEHNEFNWCSSEFEANTWSQVSARRTFTKTVGGKTVIICHLNRLTTNVESCTAAVRIKIDGQESGKRNSRFTMSFSNGKLSDGSIVILWDDPSINVGEHTYELEIYPSERLAYYGDSSMLFQVLTIAEGSAQMSIVHTANPTTQQLATCTACDLTIKESKYNNVRTIHLVRGVQYSRIDYVNDVTNYYGQTWKLNEDGTITKVNDGRKGECYGLDDVDLWTPIDYILYYE